MRVADAHNDLLLGVMHQRERGQSDPFGDFWLPQLRAGSVALQFLAVFTEDQHVGEGALRRCLLLLEEARNIAEKHPADVEVVETRQDLERALASDRIGLVLAIEGSEPVGHSLGVLETLWRLGVRCMSLTWNRRTMLADGAGEAATRAGLTTLGEEAVAEMERLGLILDVSHLSAAGFDHVAGISKRPFVATHSSCHALCPHPRNLTDEQLRDVADSGGVVGINSFGGFLSTGTPTLNDYLTHIEHAVAVAGPAAVGLGCDFMEDLLEVLDPILGAGLIDPGNMPLVTGMRRPCDLGPFSALLAGRLGAETAQRVAGENWIDLLRRVLPSESHSGPRE